MFGSVVVSPYNSWDLNAFSQYTGLASPQLQQLQAAFNQQAALNGGRLGITEFQALFSNTPGLNWNLGGNYQQNFLAFDVNGNGALTFDEFLVGYLAGQRGISPIQRWSYVVNSYPLSRPGYLSQAEAQLLLNNMQRFYNFPLQDSYFTTAWSQVGGVQGGYVPATSFVEALIPLIPQTYIW